MRFLFAAALAAHGFAHLVGFIVPWRWVDLKETPYRTTLLAGRINAGHVGIRLVSVLWLLSALAFFVVAAAVALLSPWWWVATWSVAGFSFLLCVLGWPDSKIGVFINLAILAYLGCDQFLGWGLLA
jgi:hypothetical protein